MAAASAARTTQFRALTDAVEQLVATIDAEVMAVMKVARLLEFRDLLHASVHLSNNQRRLCLILGFLSRGSKRTA